MKCVMNTLRMRLSRLAVLLLASQAIGCVVVLPDGSDYPQFVTVDAGCDADDWWILTASVDHENGPGSIVDVWAEVQLVYYDEFDQQFFDDELGWIDLALLGPGDWRVDLAPGETFLDCYYPGEYLFRFFAEDGEGDLGSVDLIN